MDGRVVLRILAVLGLIAVIAGVAGFAYNAGVSTHIQIPANANGTAPYPYYGYPFWHPFGWFGFGLFGPLIGLFFVILAVRAFLFMLWGPRWGHWRHMGRGWRHGWDEPDDVPPMFREWHDRAHGNPTQPEEPQKS